MAIPIMSEMIKNEDCTNQKVSAEKKKQDCEINAAKRIVKKFKKEYPRLKIRILADSLYPSETLIEIMENENLEYIFVLKDKKIPTITKEFFNVIEGELDETIDGYRTHTMWANEIDYESHKINVIR